MAEINKALMDIFPDSAELPDFVKHSDALTYVRRVLEASRAGIDEITERSSKVLTEDELLRLNQLSEKLGSFAIEANEYRSED